MIPQEWNGNETGTNNGPCIEREREARTICATENKKWNKNQCRLVHPSLSELPYFINSGSMTVALRKSHLKIGQLSLQKKERREQNFSPMRIFVNFTAKQTGIFRGGKKLLKSNSNVRLG